MKCVYKTINIPDIKKPVPFIICNKQKNIKRMFLFIHGLDGGCSIVKLFDKSFLNKDDCLVSIDMRGQSNNKNKTSKSYQTYVNDLVKLINYLKKEYGYQKIILLGESWGSALGMIVYTQNRNLIDQLICWNMPLRIQKIEEIPLIEFSILISKLIFSLLTNIDTFSTRKFNTKLTNNKLIARISKMNDQIKKSNKIAIAAWLCFYKSKKIVNNEKNNMNLLLIQSGEDIMQDMQMFEKIVSFKNVYTFDKGTHILSGDITQSAKLFAFIKKMAIK